MGEQSFDSIKENAFQLFPDFDHLPTIGLCSVGSSDLDIHESNEHLLEVLGDDALLTFDVLLFAREDESADRPVEQ